MREGWTYKKLGEVAAIKSGYTPSSADLLDNGVLPYFKVGDMNVEGNEKYLYHTSSFLDATFKSYPQYSIVFPKNGAAIATNKKRILSKPSVVDLNTAVLISDTNSIFTEFLYYWICKIDFRDITRRGAVPTLDVKTLMQLDVPVPSFSEQERVVSELDLLSSIIEKKKAQLKEYDKLAQSIFYDMFGDPMTNEKGWEVKKLGEVASFKNGLNYHPKDDGFQIKCIGVGDFQNKKEIRDFSSINDYSIDEDVDDSYYLKDGDIIIVRSNGSKDLVGRNMIVYPNCQKVTYSGFCIRCRLNSSTILPIILNRILSDRGTMMVLRQEGRGCNISNINQKILSSLPIILPPLSLQQSFAKKIEAIEQQKALIQQSITETETLFNSRMNYYFN